MTSHLCPNCNNEFTGKYCNNCGQKLAHRITMGHLSHDLVHAFTHTDKGFFHLMIGLFKKPGQVAREYIIEEKRKRYGSPFQYLLIIGAIATIVVVNTNFMQASMHAMGLDSTQQNNRQVEIMEKVSAFQSKYFNLMILLQLPFLSLSTFILYKKSKLNYAEHLTLHTFILAQTTLISMILMLFLFILDKSNINILMSFNILLTVASLFYHTTVYMQFFKQLNFKGALRAIWAYIFGLIIFFVSVLILSMIIGVIWGLLIK